MTPPSAPAADSPILAGSIPRALIRLALPVLASQALRVAYQWVDALWVRGLGVDATAAVTTSVFVMWAVLSLQDVFGIGVMAYVSQLVGAGDRDRAGVAAWKGLCASATIGIACAVPGAVLAPRIYELMGAPPGVVAEGGRYLGIVLAAAPLPMLGITCEWILRASGDTRTPLLVDCGAVLLNAVLSPLLIYGWAGCPRLGIAGAAWATVAAQVVMIACYATLAARRHPAFPLRRPGTGTDVRILGLARVGLPTALIGLLFSGAYLAFSRSAARFGAASLAIVGIANRIESIVFLASSAIGIGAAAMVGQNLGAGHPGRAETAIRTGVTWIAWFSLAFTALMMVAPAVLIAPFTQDPEVHRVGAHYLRVLALCLVFTGIEIVVFEAIQGSGHTLVLSWIYTVFSLVRIPLAFWVPDLMGNGVAGVAWVITATCVVRTLIIVAWAARGSWKSGLGKELRREAPPLPDPRGNP
jgi:putative MATE family efflux protein